MCFPSLFMSAFPSIFASFAFPPAAGQVLSVESVLSFFSYTVALLHGAVKFVLGWMGIRATKAGAADEVGAVTVLLHLLEHQVHYSFLLHLSRSFLVSSLLFPVTPWYSWGTYSFLHSFSSFISLSRVLVPFFFSVLEVEKRSGLSPSFFFHVVVTFLFYEGGKALAVLGVCWRS